MYFSRACTGDEFCGRLCAGVGADGAVVATAFSVPWANYITSGCRRRLRWRRATVSGVGGCGRLTSAEFDVDGCGRLVSGSWEGSEGFGEGCKSKTMGVCLGPEFLSLGLVPSSRALSASAKDR